MRKIRDNLPLALMGMAFVALAAATQCTSATGDPSANGESDAGQVGTDDSGTPLGCGQDTDCSLPRSTCEGSMLVYYTDPKCVQRKCQWQLQKQEGPYCSSGGCLGTPTSGGAGIITMPDGQAGVGFNADASMDVTEDRPNVPGLRGLGYRHCGPAGC